jgi:hypothetical protein
MIEQTSQKLIDKVQIEIKLKLIKKVQDFKGVLTEKLSKTYRIISASYI